MADLRGGEGSVVLPRGARSQGSSASWPGSRVAGPRSRWALRERLHPLDTPPRGLVPAVGSGDDVVVVGFGQVSDSITVDSEDARFDRLEVECHAGESILEAALAAGKHTYLEKPVRPLAYVRSIQRALGMAGIPPDQVDYVSASANGGRNLDRLEAAALSRVFTGQETRPRISSIKGAVGESLSSGGIRAAAAALSIKARILPPTLGLTTAVQPLNFVKAHAIDMPVACALLNGVSSGGTFASLLMRSVDGSTDLFGATR